MPTNEPNITFHQEQPTKPAGTKNLPHSPYILKNNIQGGKH